MKYKFTEQYAKDEEKLLAEFNELNDAKIFVMGKTYDDEIKSRNLIYRIYDHNANLLHIFNMEKINVPINRAKYENRDCDFPNKFYAPFIIVIKAEDGTKNILAKFNDKINANIFIVNKCNSDNTVGENDLFFIFHVNSLVDQLSKSIITKRKTESDSDTGNEKKVKFRPSPLPTKPRLGPANYWVDENNEDDETKK